MLARARFCAGAEPCAMPPSRSERAARNPAASQIALMTSSSDAITSPGLSTRLVRLASQRCARYRASAVTSASTSAAMHRGQPGRLAAGRVERVVLLGEDGVRGGQQHQVRLFRGDLQERAAGQRVAHRVLGRRLADVAAVGGQPAAQAGAARRAVAWLPPAACSRGQVAGGRSRGRPRSAAAGQRRPGAGEERRGDRRVGVRDRLEHLPGVEAQPLVGRDEGVGGRGVPGGHPAAERAPGQRQQDEAREERAQRGRGAAARRGGGVAGPGGRGARCAAGRLAVAGSVAVMSRSPRSAARPASRGRWAAAGSRRCSGRTPGCPW